MLRVLPKKETRTLSPSNPGNQTLSPQHLNILHFYFLKARFLCFEALNSENSNVCFPFRTCVRCFISDFSDFLNRIQASSSLNVSLYLCQAMQTQQDFLSMAKGNQITTAHKKVPRLPNPMSRKNKTNPKDIQIFNLRLSKGMDCLSQKYWLLS